MDVRAKQRLSYQHSLLNSTVRVAVSPHVRYCGELSSDFRPFHPVRVKRLARLDDSVSQVNQLSHRRADDRHFRFAACPHSARPLLKKAATAQSRDCRKIQGFSDSRIADLG